MSNPNELRRFKICFASYRKKLSKFTQNFYSYGGAFMEHIRPNEKNPVRGANYRKTFENDTLDKIFKLGSIEIL